MHVLVLRTGQGENITNEKPTYTFILNHTMDIIKPKQSFNDILYRGKQVYFTLKLQQFFKKGAKHMGQFELENLINRSSQTMILQEHVLGNFRDNGKCERIYKKWFDKLKEIQKL